MKTYVLITAARNEVSTIEKTIQSVITQKCLPLKWVVVSDGSNDGTDEIINNYARSHEFIHLLHRSNSERRNFGSKAKAFALGYQQVEHLEFDLVGNLDADIQFENFYYESILSKFEKNEQLGIAGGVRYDLCNGKFIRVRRARNSVCGAVQLFRRKCYESIGGYQKLQFGGIDAVAEISARMQGWQVESFPSLEIYHQRCTGASVGGFIRGNFIKGIQHYVIGYHPMFHVFRSVYHILSYPYVIGGFAGLAGYLWASIKMYEKVVSDDFIRYLRAEQLARLRSLFSLRRAIALINLSIN